MKYNDLSRIHTQLNTIYELKKDIRNMRSLTKEQIEYVKTLPKDNIIELLEIYNVCIESMVTLFMQEDKKR